MSSPAPYTVQYQEDDDRWFGYWEEDVSVVSIVYNAETIKEHPGASMRGAFTDQDLAKKYIKNDQHSGQLRILRVFLDHPKFIEQAEKIPSGSYVVNFSIYEDDFDIDEDHFSIAPYYPGEQDGFYEDPDNFEDGVIPNIKVPTMRKLEEDEWDRDGYLNFYLIVHTADKDAALAEGKARIKEFMQPKIRERIDAKITKLMTQRDSL